VNIQKKKSPAEPEAMIEVSEATEIPPDAYIILWKLLHYVSWRKRWHVPPNLQKPVRLISGPVLEV